jgi:hypothetical protein
MLQLVDPLPIADCRLPIFIGDAQGRRSLNRQLAIDNWQWSDKLKHIEHEPNFVWITRKSQAYTCLNNFEMSDLPTR